MSTRCMIKFGSVQGGKLCTEAMIYQHNDGYPDGPHGVPANLQRFFEAVEKDTDDTRFSDAQYLAAKFVVWSVNDMRERMKSWTWRKPDGRKDGLLNFLSIGISQREHGDVDFVYFVDCSPGNERPRVLYRDREARARIYVVASPKLYERKEAES